MTKDIIYLDTAAATPIAPEAIAAMVELMSSKDGYANPSSTEHLLGQKVADLIEDWRALIAHNLACKTKEVIFTSGATESNNLALRGLAQAHVNRGFNSGHIVTSAIEHKAVLSTCQALEKQGIEVTYLKPNQYGYIEADSVVDALRPDTFLVSIMHTNNETGIMQPVAEIANVLSDKKALFHVDAAQAVGKLPLNLEELPIDLLSLSAHKFYGPKGVGCLIARNRSRLPMQAIMTGGGQEFGLRSGTLATHQIAGMVTALNIAVEQQIRDYEYVSTLKELFINKIRQANDVKIHGSPARCSPYIVNFSIANISSDALINQVAKTVALSSGSACSSGAADASYVLRAMGITGDDLYGAVRASFSRYHTQEDILRAANYITRAVQSIKALSL